MSKHDSLLKKAEVYERLSLYSDRKSFLKALAQGMTPNTNTSFEGDLDPQQGITPAPAAEQLSQSDRSLLYQAQRILQSANVDTNAIGNALLFNKVDMNAIRREIQDAWMTGKLSPLSQQPQIDQLKNILSNLGRTTSGPPAPTNVATNTRPQNAGGGMPSIDKASQKAVFDFAIQTGGLVPDPQKQQADGALGPETRKALEAVKNYFAKQYPQNPCMSDAEAINAAKFKGRA